MLDKKELQNLMLRARNLFACVQGVIMKMLCQKNVFPAIRNVAHVRENRPLHALLVLKVIFWSRVRGA